MSDLDRTGNLLGALSLLIADRTVDAVTVGSVASESASAALSALFHFLDGASVDQLRQVLGLTSSGTVRLVDRLVESGYAKRGPGSDRRVTSVRLTPAGRRAAQRVAEARADVLDSSLAILSAEERDSLEGLVSKMLRASVRGPGAIRWICRMCDTQACGREDGLCPVANEARDRQGNAEDGGERRDTTGPVIG